MFVLVNFLYILICQETTTKTAEPHYIAFDKCPRHSSNSILLKPVEQRLSLQNWRLRSALSEDHFMETLPGGSRVTFEKVPLKNPQNFSKILRIFFVYYYKYRREKFMIDKKIKQALLEVNKYNKKLSEFEAGNRKTKPKKPNVGKWTSRHTHLVNAAARFGRLDIKNAMRLTETSGKTMSSKCLAAMIINNYISFDELEYKKNNVYVVSLGSKGERTLRDISSVTTGSKYNSSSLGHDLEHSNYIFDTFPLEDIQKFYRSEKELDNLGVGSSPTDGAFIYDDDRVNLYIETVTQHYTSEMKLAHLTYSQRANGYYIANKVRIPKKSL